MPMKVIVIIDIADHQVLSMVIFSIPVVSKINGTIANSKTGIKMQ